MTKRTSPFFTSCPDWKRTSWMYPETRGRTSTDSTGSVRPVNSSHSTSSFCSTGATVTVGGGGRLGAAFAPQPASRRVNDPAATAAREKVIRFFVVIISLGLRFGIDGKFRNRSGGQRDWVQPAHGTLAGRPGGGALHFFFRQRGQQQERFRG